MEHPIGTEITTAIFISLEVSVTTDRNLRQFPYPEARNRQACVRGEE